MQLYWPLDVLFSPQQHVLLDQYVSLMEARMRDGYSIIKLLVLIAVMVITFTAAAVLQSGIRNWPLVLPSRGGLRMPPGSMGWPFFGETAQLRAKGLAFYLKRRSKYGETFKSHLFGRACVVTTTVQAAKFVLVDHPELFRQRGLPNAERMLGTHFFGYSDQHRFHLMLRKQLYAGLIAHLPHLIPHLELLALSCMHTWLGGREVHVLQETKLFAVRASIFYVLGLLPNEVNSELVEAYGSIVDGFDAWRVYLPWTKYYKACQGQRKASNIINQIMKERRSSSEPGSATTNILTVLLKGDSSGQLSDRDLRETILTVLFAAHDASATVLTWAMKFLNDDPTLLDSFTKEHDEIANQKRTADVSLSLEDIKNMVVTQQVIKETLRIASPVDFSYREAVRDIAYDGFLIPKGWMVLVVHKTFHFDPHVWRHPHDFDAARFQVMPRPFTYTPFGNGAHVCLGREVAQLEIFIFLHHLAHKFRWEECKCRHGATTSPIHEPLQQSVARDYMIKLHPRESRVEFTTLDTYASVVDEWND